MMSVSVSRRLLRRACNGSSIYSVLHTPCSVFHTCVTSYFTFSFFYEMLVIRVSNLQSCLERKRVDATASALRILICSFRPSVW